MQNKIKNDWQSLIFIPVREKNNKMLQFIIKFTVKRSKFNLLFILLKTGNGTNIKIKKIGYIIRIFKISVIFYQITFFKIIN